MIFLSLFPSLPFAVLAEIIRCVFWRAAVAKKNGLAEKVLGNSYAPAGCLQDLARVADKQSRLHRSQHGRDVRVWISHLRYLFVAQHISQIGIQNILSAVINLGKY